MFSIQFNIIFLFPWFKIICIKTKHICLWINIMKIDILYEIQNLNCIMKYIQRFSVCQTFWFWQHPLLKRRVWLLCSRVECCWLLVLFCSKNKGRCLIKNTCWYIWSPQKFITFLVHVEHIKFTIIYQLILNQ